MEDFPWRHDGRDRDAEAATSDNSTDQYHKARAVTAVQRISAEDLDAHTAEAKLPRSTFREIRDMFLQRKAWARGV